MRKLVLIDCPSIMHNARRTCRMRDILINSLLKIFVGKSV